MVGGLSSQVPDQAEGVVPAEDRNFEGIGFTGRLPSDANGDIGPNHYVQAVNAHLQVFDRSGTALTGRIPIRSLWDDAGDTGACTINPRGDPVVLYDHLADRWVISQFARLAGGLAFTCVAVSRSPDPVAGGWFLYTLGVASGFEYPKMGVWPDGYYMSAFGGDDVHAYALDRAAMLEGRPARVQRFLLDRSFLFVLPGDLDGPPPPPGTPNVFARQVDGDRWGGPDRVELWALSVDWADPAASRVEALPPLPVAPFDADLCGGTPFFSVFCVPQPDTAQRLDTLPNWPMMPLQYRSFGPVDTLAFSHTVDVGADRAGKRWYELRRPRSGGWTVHQQGTYGPDDDVHRWMGSVAMNGQGDMALGYNVASERLYPGIRVVGRLVDDPLGTMPRGETIVVNGASSQEAPSWGDYSAMRVDPVDDCTFWYTAQYMPPGGVWGTRIAAFRLASCDSDLPETADTTH